MLRFQVAAYLVLLHQKVHRPSDLSFSKWMSVLSSLTAPVRPSLSYVEHSTQCHSYWLGDSELLIRGFWATSKNNAGYPKLKDLIVENITHFRQRIWRNQARTDLEASSMKTNLPVGSVQVSRGRKQLKALRSCEDDYKPQWPVWQDNSKGVMALIS